METEKWYTENILMDTEIEVLLVGGKMAEDTKNAIAIQQLLSEEKWKDSYTES